VVVVVVAGVNLVGVRLLHFVHSGVLVSLGSNVCADLDHAHLCPSGIVCVISFIRTSMLSPDEASMALQRSYAGLSGPSL
jgi:hypothetical protein